ncbi:MAG: glycerol kinase [Phycisphaerales bacterium]|nr:glycerol kinase [Phycisphaerales bacterium]
MSSRAILAIDQGTTSSRAIVFDGQDAVLGVFQQEFTQHFPQAGWVEHDAMEIWSTQLRCIQEAIATSGLHAKEINGIGITNQRETVVVWDRKTGIPVHNALVWQDRRTADMMTAMKSDGREARLRERTGLLADPYFSASKAAWILDHVAGARTRAERGELAFGTIDTWIIWNLTSGRVHATDASNASRTLLFDIRTGTWSHELCAMFNVPPSMLPAIVTSAGVVAETDASILGASIPICGIAGDQQAALFGQGCFTPGSAKNTYGTGCFLLANAGTKCPEPPSGLLATVAWKIGDEITYAIEGGVFTGGAAIQWLRDGLHMITSAKEVNTLAASVPDAGGVMVVPAFAGLGAPWWDPTARACILGLTRGSTSAHIARATLDGIAHQVADLVGAITPALPTRMHALRVDGGAAASDLLMQTQADLLGIMVERPKVLETTALGAAHLARIGAGHVRSVHELGSQTMIERTFAPSMDPAERATARARWANAVLRARSLDTP